MNNLEYIFRAADDDGILVLVALHSVTQSLQGGVSSIVYLWDDDAIRHNCTFEGIKHSLRPRKIVIGAYNKTPEEMPDQNMIEAQKKEQNQQNQENEKHEDLSVVSLEE